MRDGARTARRRPQAPFRAVLTEVDRDDTRTREGAGTAAGVRARGDLSCGMTSLDG